MLRKTASDFLCCCRKSELRAVVELDTEVGDGIVLDLEASCASKFFDLACTLEDDACGLDPVGGVALLAD